MQRKHRICICNDLHLYLFAQNNKKSPYIKRYKISFKYISHIKIIQKSLRINVAAVIPLENIYDHFYGVTNFAKKNSRIVRMKEANRSMRSCFRY